MVHVPAPVQRGFTLLEILVVLVVIGFLVGVTTLSLGGSSRVEVLDNEAKRLYALLDLATQESILQSAEMMVELEPHTYTFFGYNGEEWVPLEDDEMFRARELPEDITLSAVVDGAEMQSLLFEGRESTQIYLLSSGEVSPFEITMQLEDGPAFMLRGTMMGALSLEGPVETF